MKDKDYYCFYFDKSEVEIIRDSLVQYLRSPFLGLTGMPTFHEVKALLEEVLKETGETMGDYEDD